MPKIAVIDDNTTIVKILSDLLSQEGYSVYGMSDATDGLEKIAGFSPDLIILDVIMPEVDGYDLCRILRNDTRTSHLPVIMLTSQSDVDDKVAGLEAGADDYIVKPFEPAEVLARVKSQLRRSKQQKCFSPLTGLPGNVIIQEEINKCLSRSDFRFSILYLDLDNFKTYNDTYGFIKGDELLRATSNILRETVQRIAPLHSFVGHIGGDDFIVVIPADQMEETCTSVIAQINAAMPEFYNEADRQRGFVTARDRSGQEKQFPLVTISIAAITNKNAPLTDLHQIGELAAALKKKAKALPGSVFVVNE
ncbi:MAG: response regulator [Bacillota bacterium]|nr:response regulator [Bacillota bacterium]MDW7683768.1 response regulator [Bacillota bacterium]